MAMYQFEFIGRDGRVDVASDVLPDVEEARDHCRELFEGLGRATGTRCIRPLTARPDPLCLAGDRRRGRR
jgi:hypothetical protein